MTSLVIEYRKPSFIAMSNFAPSDPLHGDDVVGVSHGRGG
jgi:hypothetical protein